MVINKLPTFLDHDKNRTERLSFNPNHRCPLSLILLICWGIWNMSHHLTLALGAYIEPQNMIFKLAGTRTNLHSFTGFLARLIRGFCRFFKESIPEHFGMIPSTTSHVRQRRWVRLLKIDPLPILFTLGKVTGWAAFSVYKIHPNFQGWSNLRIHQSWSKYPFRSQFHPRCSRYIADH